MFSKKTLNIKKSNVGTETTTCTSCSTPCTAGLYLSDCGGALAGTCTSICNPGSVPAYYVFPAVSDECVLATIPSALGAIAGDFWLEVTAQFNSLDVNGVSSYIIFDNGISGIVDGTLSLSVYRGMLAVHLVGTPGCTALNCVFSGAGSWLQTSEIPLGNITKVAVQRVQQVCSLLVNGKVVSAVACENSALFPPPSDSNDWSILGVGAQKIAASTCAEAMFFSFTTAAGIISAITLTGGKFVHALPL